MCATKSELERYYHERQWLGHCAVHTLNSLFQENWITYNDLEAIASSLHESDQGAGNAGVFTLNPYKSLFPYLGFFDIACIIKALDRKDCRISQHIATISALSTFEYNNSDVVGIMINRESACFGLLQTRHWFAVLHDKASGIYVNLDSKLDTPEQFLNSEALQDYLAAIIADSGQIFVISNSPES